MIALVIPSIREASFKRFCDEWSKTGLFQKCVVYLVEDNPQRTFESEVPDVHLSWEDIERKLGANSWIIPRRSDCVRSFGYWRAWKDGCDYLLTLDDDCYPEPGYENLIERHLEMLNGRSRWFNTLPNVKPRGVPFYNVGSDRKVYVNHGLWTNVLDYDAPTQLVAPTQDVLPHDNRIVPQHSYFPFCGMNWMARREAIPLMYHLLMGQMPKQIDANWNVIDKDAADALNGKKKISMINNNGVDMPMLEKLQFDRFGDIWCGILMKKICDHIGWNVSSGVPYIHHDRASNVFANLKKEANGLEVNEKFWQVIDLFALDTQESRPRRLYAEVAEAVALVGREFPEHKQYFERLSEAMVIWAGLFE